MELSERLLNDAGGWQTMKQARALHELGRVSDATWQPPLLQGRVREGETEYRSGLKILSKSNVENLCGCRASKQRGAICHHSVAVGLQVLKPKSAPAAPKPEAEPPRPAAPAPAAAPAKGPRFNAATGEPVALSVILPPNLESGFLKGGVTAGIEAVQNGRRLLVSALNPSGEYRCDEADLKLVTTLRELTGGEVPGTAMFPKEQFLALLAGLAGHPRVTFGRSTAVTVEGQGFRPELKFEESSSGALRLRTLWPADLKVLHSAAATWVLRGNVLSPVAPGLSPAYREVLQREITIPAEHTGIFLLREVGALRPFFEFRGLPESGAAPAISTGLPSAGVVPEFALQLEGSLNHLTARLEARYGDHRITLPSAGVKLAFPRNFAVERDTVSKLEQSGFQGPDSQGQWVLRGEPRILSFFARDLPRWEREVAVTVGARFEHVTKDVERVQPRLEIRGSGENWFDLQVELVSEGGERFSASEIQRLLQAGQSHMRRKNGKLAVFDPEMLEEFQQVLQDCDPQQKQPGLYRLDRRHAGYLDGVAAEQGNPVQAPEEWRSWATTTRSIDKIEAVPLGSLEETLRPYQKQGVYWMHFLAKNRLAGILADEMGLGKTVQTLALLRILGGKALIVCPSSLVYNWEREAARFTPERRVLAIVGADRRAMFGEPLKRADLVITSYGLLRRDLELYRSTEFSAAVLDEAHHIKNPDTQNAQAAFALRATNRFALTGTPIENSLRDIWSLMQFLMPGYLGKRDDFRERYEKPITTTPDGPEQGRLAKRLRPFVLRRTKKLVATELPEKIIQVTYCELGDAQKRVYADLLSAARRQASELAGAKDQGKRRIAILTALLRLRQACCDLRLLSETADPADASAKLELLQELLGEALDGGHRVLIFSQFVSMLKLARESLTGMGIESCYLDGSTRDRGREVDRFQNGAAPVFLVSLKAGGTGLNLTAADTVVHFDPWWNPAVEDQATDRAHRIGQKNVVTAYKLIARDTVEEKILALQNRKRKLSDVAVESEQPLMQGLQMEDLEELLG